MYWTLIMKCPKCFWHDYYKSCPICDHQIPEGRNLHERGLSWVSRLWSSYTQKREDVGKQFLFPFYAHILGLVKSCLSNNVPQFSKNYFKLNKEVISRETRRSNFIYLPAVRTETATKSFYYNSSVVYNNYLVNKN